LADTPATSYKFTLAVWRPGANYLPIQKLRAWSKARNTIRSGLKSIPGIGRLVRAPKTGEQIKKSAIKKQAAKQAGYGVSEQTKKNTINEMEQHSDAIGHTWIRLSSYVGDQLKQISSYGFWPESGFTRPDVAVKGAVHDPDHAHDKDSNVKALDTMIPAAKFKAGRGPGRPTGCESAGLQADRLQLHQVWQGHRRGWTGGKFPGEGTFFRLSRRKASPAHLQPA